MATHSTLIYEFEEVQGEEVDFHNLRASQLIDFAAFLIGDAEVDKHEAIVFILECLRAYCHSHNLDFDTL